MRDKDLENIEDEYPYMTPAIRHQCAEIQKQNAERMKNDPEFLKKHVEKLGALTDSAIEIINPSTGKPFRGRLRSRMRRKVFRLLGIDRSARF